MAGFARLRSAARRLASDLGADRSPALAALTLAQGGATLGASVALPVLAPLLRAAGGDGGPYATALGVGVLFAVLGVVRSVLQVPLGRVSDRLGARKPFIEGGLLGSAVALVAHALAGSVAGLFAARALQGVALACSTPAIMATLGAVTDRGSRGGSVGAFSTVRTLGLGLGPVVGGTLATAFGVDAALLCGAVLLCGAAALVRVGVPETGTPAADADADDDRAAALIPTATGGRIFSDRRQARTLLGLAGGIVALMVGVTAMIPLEGAMLDRMGDAGTAGAFGLVFASTTLTRLVAQYPVSAATDSPERGRREFVVAGLLCAAPLVALMGVARSLWEFLALRSLLGVALAGVVAPAYALAADAADDDGAGVQFGLVTTAFSGGYAIGPVIAGALAALGFAVPFLVAGGALVVGSVGVWWTVEEPRPGEAAGGIEAEAPVAGSDQS